MCGLGQLPAMASWGLGLRLLLLLLLLLLPPPPEAAASASDRPRGGHPVNPGETPRECPVSSGLTRLQAGAWGKLGRRGAVSALPSVLLGTEPLAPALNCFHPPPFN